eukprot:jgi/Mesen1/2002/ME000147S01099
MASTSLAGASVCLTKDLIVPKYVEVVVEIPKGSFLKKKPDGSIDFVGPLPCPFNYGSVRGIMAPDGDPLDAVVLGPTLPSGHVGTWHVRGMVKFTDAGHVDNKLVCTQHPPARPPTGGPHGSSTAAYPLTRLCTPVVTASDLRSGRNGPAAAAQQGPSRINGLQQAGGRSRAPGLVAGAESGTGSGGGGEGDMTLGEWLMVTSFFSSYSVMKGALNTARGKFGRTAFEGWETA